MLHSRNDKKRVYWKSKINLRTRWVHHYRSPGSEKTKTENKHDKFTFSECLIEHLINRKWTLFFNFFLQDKGLNKN